MKKIAFWKVWVFKIFPGEHIPGAPTFCPPPSFSILPAPLLNISEKMKHLSHQSSTRDGTKRTSTGVLKQTKSHSHFSISCFYFWTVTRHMTSYEYSPINTSSSNWLQWCHQSNYHMRKATCCLIPLGVSSLASFQHGTKQLPYFLTALAHY